uniref:Phosphatidylinositol-4-phosphate 5-kinase like 1 n=1 Tax=Sphenodon punctatus TaxID=8508 RepID=A0A8D0HFV9_SPHPU
MRSVFFPDERIVERYDIKGCQVSRWTQPALEGSQVIVVLKDLNFEGNSIHLGQQRHWFTRQMKLDSQFLEELGVLDYSLLVALQPLHADEQSHKLSFGTIIIRTSAQNRRLLPNTRNPLHVIDGPELRYFVGVIDLFTVYSWRKRLEHLWKCIRYRGQSFSTVSPSQYARRLCQWVEEHTM